MYFSLASSWVIPLRSFHEFHLALPFKSNIPGFSASEKRKKTCRIFTISRTDFGFLNKISREFITCIVITKRALLEQRVKVQELLVCWPFRQCFDFLSGRFEILCEGKTSKEVIETVASGCSLERGLHLKPVKAKAFIWTTKNGIYFGQGHRVSVSCLEPERNIQWMKEEIKICKYWNNSQ